MEASSYRIFSFVSTNGKRGAAEDNRGKSLGGRVRCCFGIFQVGSLEQSKFDLFRGNEEKQTMHKQVFIVLNPCMRIVHGCVLK